MDSLPQPRLPLSLALGGLATAENDARRLIDTAAERGFRAVQLDAAHRSTRPRSLERSGRRDLAALLRRRELTVSGVDLFLPPEHLFELAHADRAVAALVAAIEFASEMAGLTGGEAKVSTTLPADDRAAVARATLGDAAQASGVRIADHAWPAVEADPAAPIGVGIDPATVILAGGDPAAAVSAAGAGLVSARLADATASARTAPNDGRLDELGYAVAVMTAGYGGWVPLDLRGVAWGPERAREILGRHQAELGGGLGAPFGGPA